MMDTNEWMKLATGTGRPFLTKVHGCAGADGYRMHIENNGEPCNCDDQSHKGFDSVIEMVKDAPLAFAIDKKFLMDALSGMEPDGDHPILLFFTQPGSKSPIVIQDADAERTAIIMPLNSSNMPTKPQDLPRVAQTKESSEFKPSRYALVSEEVE
jgi:hypothetical protein